MGEKSIVHFLLRDFWRTRRCSFVDDGEEKRQQYKRKHHWVSGALIILKVIFWKRIAFELPLNTFEDFAADEFETVDVLAVVMLSVGIA